MIKLTNYSLTTGPLNPLSWADRLI